MDRMAHLQTKEHILTYCAMDKVNQYHITEKEVVVRMNQKMVLMEWQS